MTYNDDEDIIAKNYYFFVILILVIGFAIRLYSISDYPAGLNQDEASIGYEAFSILNSGSDRNGNSYPVHLVAWGNGQNALYAYLTIPFIKYFGLNEFSVRIVNSLFSCLSLIVFYLLFRLVFEKKKSLVALAILVICPWSIMSARWGLESNIFPSIFLLGVFFLVKGIVSSKKYLTISFVTFAISLYSYGTSYLILPLFLLFIIPYLIYTQKTSQKRHIFNGLLFLIVASPIILFVLINHLSLSQIEIFNITIPRLDSNRTTQIFNLFSSDFLSVIIKNFARFLHVFVMQTDGNHYNAIPSFGTIYLISFPFFIVGLLGVLNKQILLNKPIHYIFIVWFFCAVILGLSSSVNINRLNIIYYPSLYFVVLGIFDVSDFLQAKYKNHFKYLIVSIYTLLFLLFIGFYFIYFNDKSKDDFSFGLGKAIQYAEELEPNETINITENVINMPYIYVCFYNQINPEVFRMTVVYGDSKDGFKNVKSFDHYTFGNENRLGISIISKEEMKFNKYDLEIHKNFGNFYVVRYKK